LEMEQDHQVKDQEVEEVWVGVEEKVEWEEIGQEQDLQETVFVQVAELRFLISEVQLVILQIVRNAEVRW